MSTPAFMSNNRFSRELDPGKVVDSVLYAPGVILREVQVSNMSF